MTGTDEADVVVRLPDDLRSAFKDPFGPLYTDPDALLADAGTPLIAVGDIVTYHFEEAGHQPDVAIVDGRTKRQAVEDSVRETVDGRSNRIHARNPAATLTAELLSALVEALDAPGKTTVVVDGEEDLAAVPAVVAAPTGATVVYGQPDEGMVAVAVTEETRAAFRDLLDSFDGDPERAFAMLSA